MCFFYKSVEMPTFTGILIDASVSNMVINMCVWDPQYESIGHCLPSDGGST